ncbi:DNA cytosine methyltransferase [Aneurinibacillus aneurinilyticus]|uniref:DNA cytosine methyltransferase n=1 Tax=Aneurinibacillus aneurinilyticus TaxID=1391 RepID=UPI0023F56979|nr:DNA cytosine methyltransferase [Aneurinibacillus aneurinilyticus]
MRAVGEIIVDNFAGGGGASTGIEMAIGRSVDIAINHDEDAIAMHQANHPDTEHYCESVWTVNPKEAVKGRSVALAWFSPDCKHFSKAKGGKPVEKNIRGLAWVAVKWANAVKPRVIMLENVEEFKTWGPLLKNGKPDPDRKGETFAEFVNALKKRGYEVDYRELRACDYGAPTIRKRFFLIARCDGKPIVWPDPTHGDPNSDDVKKGKLMPWRTAAEIIDWSQPCPSIFERKKPLAENTLRRIARGIKRFVLENPRPFIVRIGQTGFGGDRLQYEIEQPLTTITTKAEHLLVQPFIAKHYGGGYTGPGTDCNEPLSTVTTVDHNALVTAFLSKYYGETSPTEVRGHEPDEPLHTISTANRFALVTSHLVKFRGTCKDGQPVTQPMPTITAGGQHVGEVRAFLLKYYGAGIGQDVREPLHTVPTKDRFGLVTIHGQDYQIVDIGMRMLQPHELFAAQGFPSNYIIDKDHNGNSYPKAEQVKRCGNSVPPPFAEHLVRANLPEHCTGAGKALTFERYKEAVGQLQFSM